jgi:hypothetical protein
MNKSKWYLVILLPKIRRLVIKGNINSDLPLCVVLIPVYLCSLTIYVDLKFWNIYLFQSLYNFNLKYNYIFLRMCALFSKWLSFPNVCLLHTTNHSKKISFQTSVGPYIYIYMCVCVCVRARVCVREIVYFILVAVAVTLENITMLE